jgi:hypothetical protein
MISYSCLSKEVAGRRTPNKGLELTASSRSSGLALDLKTKMHYTSILQFQQFPVTLLCGANRP